MSPATDETAKIRILNKGKRNQLVVQRADGSYEMADLGPSLPFHDLADYVVEKKLKLRRGFYGNIYNGYSVAELSTKEIIQSLSLESGVSEIITRALQSLHTGACTTEQFMDLIQQEFDKFNIVYELNLDTAQIKNMLLEYEGLIQKWKTLSEGESVELYLDFN